MKFTLILICFCVALAAAVAMPGQMIGGEFAMNEQKYRPYGGGYGSGRPYSGRPWGGYGGGYGGYTGGGGFGGGYGR